MKRILVAVMACVGVWLASPTGQTQQPDPVFVPGEALVKFRSTASNTRRTTVLASQSANVIRHLEALDIDHIRLAPGQNVEGTVAALQANPDVESAQANYIRQHTAPPPPNDPRWLDDTLWGLVKIQAHPTWTTFSTGSSSVIVADIDTGVDYTHPDLAANMWHNPLEIPGDGIDNDSNGWVDDVFGIDVVNGDGDPMDDNNHGTHTSGTIGGVGNDGVGIVGVNWTTRILACKFLNAGGSGSDSGAATCFNYIVAMKQRGENIRVSSNSWGGGGGGATLKTAIDNAGNNGIINIFAAGNNSRDIDAAPFFPASYDSPSIVSVGASTQTDTRASFSNWGLTSVDLAAPGVSIYSTIRSSGYAFFNGTSMATPHVAGAAAILYAMDPNLSVTSVKSLLMNNVDQVPGWSGLSVTGGRLNLFKAAQAVGGGGGQPSAIFVGTDATTKGNWPGAYGEDGYNVIGDAVSYPSYAVVTPSGQSTWVWDPSPSDVRALLKASGPGRIAATWYGATFDIDLNLVDGLAHQVAFYSVDYDTTARSQQFDVLNAATSAVLDTRTISSFNGGTYLVWTITGHVKVRITRLAGANAVLSGLFFGQGNQPPVVNITDPTEGATFPPGSTIHLAADASDPDGSINSVAFHINGSPTPLFTDTAAPYEYNWPSVPAGAYTLTAVATDNELRQTTSGPRNFTVGGGGGTSVVFVGTDSTTQGTWQGTYGADGYNVINDAVSYPGYASVTPSGQSNWTWEASTSDVRALQKASGPGRIAATWYGATFDIAVNLLDGLPHEVALYSVDYDTTLRGQRFDVLNAATSAVLDTRSISSFTGGRYLVWRITGNVIIRITLTGGANAVVSGLFFDPPTAPLPLTWLSSPNSGAYTAAGTDLRHGSALLVRDFARRASSTAAGAFSVPVFTKPDERQTRRR